MKKPWTKEGKILERVPVQTKHGTSIAGRWKSIEQKPGTKYFPKIQEAGKKARAVSWQELRERYAKTAKTEPFGDYVTRHYTPYAPGNSTAGIYHKDEARHRLREAIVRNVVDYANTPPIGQKPIAILIGGGAASGKSYVRDTLIDPALKAGGVRVGICDPDDMKTRLPEWDYLVETDPKHAGSVVHKESVRLANSAFYTLMSEGKNLLFDNSMRVVGEYRDKIEALHEHGYNVVIIGVTTDVDTALERAHQRERQMPDDKVRQTHSGFATAWEFIKDYADDYQLYDTTTGELELVEDISGVQNHALMDRFYDRGKNGERRKYLRAAAKKYGADFEAVWDMYKTGTGMEEIVEMLKEGGRK